MNQVELKQSIKNQIEELSLMKPHMSAVAMHYQIIKSHHGELNKQEKSHLLTTVEEEIAKLKGNSSFFSSYIQLFRDDSDIMECYCCNHMDAYQGEDHYDKVLSVLKKISSPHIRRIFIERNLLRYEPPEILKIIQYYAEKNFHIYRHSVDYSSPSIIDIFKYYSTRNGTSLYADLQSFKPDLQLHILTKLIQCRSFKTIADYDKLLSHAAQYHIEIPLALEAMTCVNQMDIIKAFTPWVHKALADKDILLQKIYRLLKPGPKEKRDYIFNEFFNSKELIGSAIYALLGTHPYVSKHTISDSIAYLCDNSHSKSFSSNDFCHIIHRAYQRAQYPQIMELLVNVAKSHPATFSEVKYKIFSNNDIVITCHDKERNINFRSIVKETRFKQIFESILETSLQESPHSYKKSKI